METPTPEQIQKHISAAFDSVNLINNTITKPATENTKSTVDFWSLTKIKFPSSKIIPSI